MSDSVFAIPRNHKMIYSACVANDVANNLNMDVVKLTGEDANPENVEQAIKSEDPSHFWSLGHGSKSCVTLSCRQRFLGSQNPDKCSYTPQRLKLFKNRVVHMLSCKVGKELGPALVNEGGADAFIGYREPFYFYVGDNPCESKAARAPHRADLEVEIQLDNGKSVGEAYNASQDKFDELKKYYDKGAGTSHRHSELLVRLLSLDKRVQTLIGEEKTTVSKKRVPFVKAGGEVILASLATGALIKKFLT